jgi:hypothetical protein
MQCVNNIFCYNQGVRNYTYNVRITDELKERLWKMTKETGVQHTGLVEDFIKNLCNFYEEHREIRPPFAIIPKKDLELLKINAPAQKKTPTRKKTDG